MTEFWQLYDEQGLPLAGQASAPADILERGLLHGAAHVWVWRKNAGEIEVLLQKRAPSKYTWPDYLDISAAGHIDQGEEPIAAALRETEEEIGLRVSARQLKFVGIHRTKLTAPGGAVEHEFQWLYLSQWPPGSALNLQKSEVIAAAWKPISVFGAEVRHNDSEGYVPHGPVYFETVIAVLKATAAQAD